jgi:hypothetical protein
MMHGDEKSDPSIVAVKPANKGRQLSAELVEPRGMRDSAACAGHWAGKVCPTGWTAYGK